MTTRTLDVRALAPPARHPEVFKLFGSLREGESFVLVNDHDPKPLLYQFQAERAREFEWSPLETGPESWRVEIARRRPAPRGVAEFLQADHRRLDSLFEQGRFSEFRVGLDRHIRIEEEILFPVFDERAGMPGPTQVMRHEHTEIRRLLPALPASGRELRHVLAQHNVKEESILYPTCDNVVEAAERETLVQEMQRVS